MKCQPARRLYSYTPKPIGRLSPATVEAIAGMAHKRAIAYRADRGAWTALFVNPAGDVFAFSLDGPVAVMWLADRTHHLAAVLDPARPDYSKAWLLGVLHDEMEAL